MVLRQTPGPPPQQHGRFVELDGLRGIAAMAVVLMHLTTAFDRFFPHHEPFPFHMAWGGLGVQLFFMISGFVIFATTRRHPTAGRFALARAVRLYPTYWVCVMLTIVITWKIDELSQVWQVNLVNLSMLQSFVRVRDIDGSYWSLACELTFYALIGVLLLVTRGRVQTRMVLLFVVSWPIVGLAVSALATAVPALPVQLLDKGLAGEFAPLFCIGIVMQQVRTGHTRWLLLIAPLTVIAVMVALLNDHREAAWPLVPVIAGFMVVTALPGVRWLRSRPLTWLGAISFPLYLLHQNIGYTVLKFTVDPLGPWLSRAVALVVVVLMAWIVHHLVETRLTESIATWIGQRLGPAHPHDKEVSA